MAIIGHWSIGLVALDFGASEGISHLRMDIARQKKRPRYQFLRLYLKPKHSREASHTSLEISTLIKCCCSAALERED
jgi:hypothetical protein